MVVDRRQPRGVVTTGTLVPVAMKADAPSMTCTLDTPPLWVRSESSVAWIVAPELRPAGSFTDAATLPLTTVPDAESRSLSICCSLARRTDTSSCRGARSSCASA